MQETYNLILNKIDESQIKLNEPMSKHTSFRIGGSADIFVKVGTTHELEYVLEVAKKDNIPLTIIREWYKCISERPEELEA